MRRTVSSHSFILLCATGLGGLAYAEMLGATEADNQAKRPVTVADGIRMTRFGDPRYTDGFSSQGLVGRFSPDGRQFVVLLKKGNLENNTNEYSLLLFKTEEVIRSPKPDVLVTMASSSNRPAIQNINWLPDSETLLFLGERPGELQQLYSLDCRTRELTRIANHSTNIVSYSATPNGDRIVFAAEFPAGSNLAPNARAHGIRVSTESVTDLIAENSGGFRDYYEVFLKDKNSNGARKIAGHNGELFSLELSVSPNGRYVVLTRWVTAVPKHWRRYQDEFLQGTLPEEILPPSHAGAVTYQVMDLTTGKIFDLLNTPGLLVEFLWLADSKSVVLSPVYLPLDVPDAEEAKRRESTVYAVEIEVPGLGVTKISNAKNWLRPVRWDSAGNRLLFVRGEPSSPGEALAFARDDRAWKEVEAGTLSLSADGAIDVILDEDMNTPPRIFVVNLKSRDKSLLLDLNPQFSELNLGKLKEVSWRANDGREVRGGLYLPPSYIAGTRYPLVIQTHGFSTDRFRIDGSFPTASGAQALASAGFVVLQADMGMTNIGTEKEASSEVAAYEGAIRYLDRLGIIDPERVGLVGFSRTCYHVKYALTHSEFRFGAATVADGMDAGYFQYIAFSASSQSAYEFERLNGGPPFGRGLSSWIKRSPSFRLDRVRTPLRIEAIGPASLLQEWEWFAGLSRLKKPVDLIYIPEGEHILEKPWERMTSQEGNVDWFRFWLKGEEDPDPSKRVQYQYWRALRRQRDTAKAREGRGSH